MGVRSVVLHVNGSVQTKRVLEVNERIELAIDSRLGTAYYPSRVEDVYGDQLVVALPTESPELASARAGLALGVVKKADEGLIVLNATVVGKLLSPIPLLTLKTEGEWTRIQRRRDVRLSITIGPLRAIPIDQESAETVEIRILNISAGGLLFRAKEKVEPSRKLLVKFDLPDCPPPIEAVIEIVRIDDSEISQWKHFKMGARFVDLNQKKRDQIVKFIFREQVRRAKMGRR